jgi:copper chaperone CopZ
VGKAALEGLDGVKKVSNGWSDFTEINTVYYDPEKITVKEMEKVLKKAGTYKKTIQGD